jgi:hypothetical protein
MTSLWCQATRNGYLLHIQGATQTWTCKDCGWSKTVRQGEWPCTSTQGHLRPMPMRMKDKENGKEAL